MGMKVLVPDLPSADELLPYLRRIDAARHYSNDGPLVRELEARTGGVAVSSGTLGLELAARWAFRGRRVRIPAFTFPATATALLRSGCEPVLCDVDRDTWALVNPEEPDSLPVAPFGAAVSGPLVDAAGAWGNGQGGNAVFSLHATKVLPAGEGGLVVGEPDLLDYVRRARNFGLDAGLVVQEGGTNAKLSEYHAAVALASLERFERVRAKRMALEARYRANLAGLVQVQQRPPGAYAIFPVVLEERDRVARLLAVQGIETRAWYCPSLEKHDSLSNLQVNGSLENAKMLGDGVLCLPFHSFLTEADVDAVCDALRSAVSQRGRLRATA